MEKIQTKIHNTFLYEKALMSVFQFCLHGLSPGDCTMAIQPLEDNHQYLTKIKKIFFFIKSKLYSKDMKIK